MQPEGAAGAACPAVRDARARRRLAAGRAPRLVRSVAAAIVAGMLAAAPAPAATLRAAVQAGAAQQALAAAVAGDTVVLASGPHDGPLRIDRTLTLRGEPGAWIDGGGAGTVLEIAASGTHVEDLEVRGSGRRVLTVDSGIHIVRAAHVRIERVRMRDVLYGVYAERAESLTVLECDLTGRVRPLDEAGEGNGIHLWSSAGASLRGNQVTRFLDAIYLSFADGAEVAGNQMEENGRYGLHTMYCQRNRLTENRFTKNAAGIAIMFSNHLVVERNVIVRNRGPRTHGMLLRDCSDGEFVDNRLVDNTVALFLDGSNRNRFERNLIQDNGWGLVLFASCADNVWTANDFIQNDYPVALDMRRTRNRFDDGARGNYWSEAETYDLDGDGVGDAPFGPVTAFAFVSKQYPDLAVLAKSPAVAALSVAERVFPSLRPSEAVDSFPLTHPLGGRARVGRTGPAAPARSWGHVALFAGFTLVGVAGLTRGGRR
jgi:nitrous oxidase accessory protein